MSSPGIERILRKEEHFIQNIGKKIEIKLFKKDESGRKQIIGILKKIDEENISVEVEDNILEINRRNISQVKTVYEW